MWFKKFFTKSQSEEQKRFRALLINRNHASKLLTDEVISKQHLKERIDCYKSFYVWELSCHENDVLETHTCLLAHFKESVVFDILNDGVPDIFIMDTVINK